METLDTVRAEALDAVAAAADLDALEQVRVRELGKKGRLTLLLKSLGGLDAEARKAAGQALNVVKEALAATIEARKSELARAALESRLAGEKLDITLPVRPETRGSIHPISQTIDEVVAIFGEMGFTVAEGPDIEDDWHNFTALNIPPEHPARQEMDTFYLPGTRDGHGLTRRPSAGSDRTAKADPCKHERSHGNA